MDLIIFKYFKIKFNDYHYLLMNYYKYIFVNNV